MADNSIPTPTTKPTPTLTSALSSSIRHHARIIDGRDAQQQQLHGVSIPHPAYDEEHVALSTSTERGFEYEAKLAVESRQYEAIRDTALLDFLSNPQGDVNPTARQNPGASGRSKDTKAGLSTWFRGNEAAPKEKSVRFADAGNFTSVMMMDSKVPKQWGRSNFVAPPPTSFRLATRHPSQGYYQPGVSRSALQNRKRNDQLFRLIIGILCFGMSLTFVLFLSNGKWDAYMSSLVTSHPVMKNSDQDELELFYPTWWREEKDVPDMEARQVELTGATEYNVADVAKERAPGRIETPFLWLIPKSGGNVIRTAFESCEKLIEASDLGIGSDQSVLLVQEINQQRFVNVDMYSVEGLVRAKELNLASSGVPDIIMSDMLLETLEVFNNRNRARLFAIFRHPLERAISKYYSDLGSNPNLAGYTLPQYVRAGSDYVENNYITRHILGYYTGVLELKHLDYAREFLRRKVVVGLASDLRTSGAVFNKVFTWNEGDENASSHGACYKDIFHALSDKSPPAIEEGSEGWKLLVAQNWFDLKVYEYIEFLFEEQLKKMDIKKTGLT